ncbi:MAG: glycosyltransferase, partial [Alphaproteobacteria bacterium]|nr:glycosyltransferase [Alphaproteobacteria bacterium]
MKPLDHHQVAFRSRRRSLGTVQSIDEFRTKGAPSREGEIRRVALFSGNFNYLVDGAAKALNRLVAHLEKRSIEVMIFSPTTGTAAFEPVGTLVSAPSVPLPGRGEYRLALGFTPRLKRRLEAFQPD